MKKRKKQSDFAALADAIMNPTGRYATVGRHAKKPKKTATDSPIVAAAEAFVGGTSLTTLFKAATWFVGKKGKFRRAIIAQLGGKTQYREVSEKHAGTRVRFGGHRREPGAPAITIDDSGVKVLKHVRWASMNAAIYEHTLNRYREVRRRLENEHLKPDERAILTATRRELKPIVRADRSGCWTSESVYDPITVRIKTSDGPADVLWRKLRATVYVSPKGNRYVAAKSNEKATLIIGTGEHARRLRRFEGSLEDRKRKQETEQLERGKAALKRKRLARREKKLARKKKSSSRRTS